MHVHTALWPQHLHTRAAFYKLPLESYWLNTLSVRFAVWAHKYKFMAPRENLTESSILVKGKCFSASVILMGLLTLTFEHCESTDWINLNNNK